MKPAILSAEVDWTMPFWMRPYSRFIHNQCESVEQAVNTPACQEHHIVTAQVRLLARLHADGHLR